MMRVHYCIDTRFLQRLMGWVKNRAAIVRHEAGIVFVQKLGLTNRSTLYLLHVVPQAKYIRRNLGHSTRGGIGY